MEAGLHVEHPMQCSVVQNEVEACGRLCAGCAECIRPVWTCALPPEVVSVSIAKRKADGRVALMARRLAGGKQETSVLFNKK